MQQKFMCKISHKISVLRKLRGRLIAQIRIISVRQYGQIAHDQSFRVLRNIFKIKEIPKFSKDFFWSKVWELC